MPCSLCLPPNYLPSQPKVVWNQIGSCVLCDEESTYLSLCSMRLVALMPHRNPNTRLNVRLQRQCLSVTLLFTHFHQQVALTKRNCIDKIYLNRHLHKNTLTNKTFFFQIAGSIVLSLNYLGVESLYGWRLSMRLIHSLFLSWNKEKGQKRLVPLFDLW